MARNFIYFPIHTCYSIYMNDKQFKDFSENFNKNFAAMKTDLAIELSEKIDAAMDQKFLVFEEKIMGRVREELTDIRSNIDWIIDALDTDEKERLALIYSNERQFNDHERRISKLELATK